MKADAGADPESTVWVYDALEKLHGIWVASSGGFLQATETGLSCMEARIISGGPKSAFRA